MAKRDRFLFATLILANFLNIEAAEEQSATTTSTDESKVNYQTLVPGVPLILGCNTTSTERVFWYKENVVIQKMDNIDVLQNGKYLKIVKAIGPLLGNYTCKLNDSANFFSYYRVIAKPTVKLPADKSVVEGEKLHLTCEALSTLGPEVSWRFGNKVYAKSEGRVKLSKDEERDVENAVLTVDDMKIEDFGNVTCEVRYAKVHGDSIATATTYVRVKDKLAPLWPFLGICAEVLVLCAVIIIYEKKRNTAELDESDTDQGPETKPTPDKDSDVRQRN